MIEKEVSRLFHLALEKVFGANTLLSFLSYQGKIGRNQFFCIMVLIGLLIRSLSGYLLLKYIIGFLLFYVVLATVQKRCRDFGSNGTIYVVAYTVYFIFFAANYFVSDADINAVWINIRTILALMVIIAQAIFFIILSYKISKPEADMNLRSPLLKYPLLYTTICWVLAIAATLAVNHYAGIEVF